MLLLRELQGVAAGIGKPEMRQDFTLPTQFAVAERGVTASREMSLMIGCPAMEGDAQAAHSVQITDLGGPDPDFCKRADGELEPTALDAISVGESASSSLRPIQ